jgi:hypothetical protein
MSAMENEHDSTGDIQDDIERAIESVREDVLAADATGMLGTEEAIRTVELREGEEAPKP